VAEPFIVLAGVIEWREVARAASEAQAHQLAATRRRNDHAVRIVGASELEAILGADEVQGVGFGADGAGPAVFP
jgi:hypothetical protein